MEAAPARVCQVVFAVWVSVSLRVSNCFLSGCFHLRTFRLLNLSYLVCLLCASTYKLWASSTRIVYVHRRCCICFSALWFLSEAETCDLPVVGGNPPFPSSSEKLSQMSMQYYRGVSTKTAPQHPEPRGTPGGSPPPWGPATKEFFNHLWV